MFRLHDKCIGQALPGLPVARILCQNHPLKNLTATIFLTVAVLLGSAGMSWSAEFQKALDAAERGDAGAQFDLGLIYEEGQGVPQNYKTAAKWYELAAKQGLADAQNRLGFMYTNGQGVPWDRETALKWYRLAAEQGYAPAQFNLSWMYRKGKGVSQDDKTAVMWYRRAAEQGHLKAMFNMGIMYFTGKGVGQDYVHAYMWGNLAARRGNKYGGDVQSHVVKLMTPAEISTAQKLARECLQKKYKGC